MPNSILAGTKLKISSDIDLFIKKADESDGIKPGKDFQDWAKSNPDKALQKHKSEGGLKTFRLCCMAHSIIRDNNMVKLS